MQVEEDDMDMFLAVKTRHLDRLKKIVQDEGLQVLHQRDPGGHTITHWAAQTGNTEILAWLVQNQVGEPQF